MTDQFYIQKVIEGDTESFRFLVDRYRDKAYSVAFRVLRNQLFTEDVVQEAFLKAFRKIDTFRGDAMFSTWLMRIVVNESIKVLRRKKMEFEGHKQMVDVDEAGVNNSIKLLQEKEQRVFINKTLEQLPQREALVLQLFYLDDLSIKEMEEIMDIKYDHIKVLLYRARKRFYVLLKEELKHELKTII